MAEPPLKRARRTDSSAMWDRNDDSAKSAGQGTPRDMNSISSERDRGGRDEGGRRNGARDDRRYRSRSRERIDRRRERSRSGDRQKGTTRERDGHGGRDRKGRERSLSRDRHRPRKGDFYDGPPARSDRHRTRSRSPRRNDTRTRSPARKPPLDRPKDFIKPDPDRIESKTKPSQPRSKTSLSTTTNGNAEKMQIDEIDDEGLDAEETAMKAIMGFGKFKTTKNTKVPGNDVSGVRKEKKTEYRQYMNRVGGFNRPLSPSREA
ncbi:MAG: hypothetical protein M1827_003595 [Pycnora praestabilis]|nr:MAG: hypothetical protein M1827_003595 [Pycnora praestabilis]